MYKAPCSSTEQGAQNLWRVKVGYSKNLKRTQRKSASTDHEATRTYTEKIWNIIAEQGYTADQVFNTDKSRLWWEKLPSKIFISQNEKTAPGFKVSKDTFITKPSLVYRSLKPRAWGFLLWKNLLRKFEKYRIFKESILHTSG